MIQTGLSFPADNNLRRRGDCRNPVFALEMIQTGNMYGFLIFIRECRNPVFALEMIQTGVCSILPFPLSWSQSSIRPGDDSDC